MSELLGGTCDFDGISPPPDLQADNLSRAMNSVPEDLRSAGAEADEGSKQVPRTTSHARACCLALTAHAPAATTVARAPCLSPKGQEPGVAL